MKSLTSIINKFKRELKWILIALVISFLASIFAILFTKENDFLSFFSVFSCLLSVITTFVVLKLYDEFDSKKVKFSRTVNAVDELVAKITSIPFFLNYYEYEEVLNGENSNEFLKRQAKGRIYLDETGIEVIKKAKDINHKIYFSDGLLKSLSEHNVVFFNPWLPKEIKYALKGLVIFNNANQVYLNRITEEVIIISNEYMKLQVDHFEYYITDSYGVNKTTINIATLGQLADYIENLLNVLKHWYEMNMDAVPDFSGY